MYKAGNILYFTPFYFRNGNIPKSKYFIVLKEVGSEAVLVSLPTRGDFIPESKVVDFGCVELPEMCINCYVFSPDRPVTKCGKHFDFKTHIYGYQLDSYEIDFLDDIYRNEGSDYEIFGEMRDDLFVELVNCLKKSNAVKKKYIKLLNS